MQAHSFIKDPEGALRVSCVHGSMDPIGLCLSRTHAVALCVDLVDLWREPTIKIFDCPGAQHVTAGAASGDIAIEPDRCGVPWGRNGRFEPLRRPPRVHDESLD